MNAQYFIAIFGLGAVYMSMVSKSEKVRKFAPFVALVGQPFWLYATGTAQQWGMFALCCAYTIVYCVAAVKNAAAIRANAPKVTT